MDPPSSLPQDPFRTSTSSYVCDTIPAPRLASTENEPCEGSAEADSATFVVDEVNALDAEKPLVNSGLPSPSSLLPARKLCVRHQRMADEGTNLKLQQSLDALPVEERQVVNSIWSNFSSSSHPRRALILQGLLTMCCFSQLSLLTDQLSHLIRIDPFTVLPREISLKVLRYLDAISLCRAAQVTKVWKSLADDDVLWRGICEQHIGQKCHKCGWGLPVLEKRRACTNVVSPCPSPDSHKRPLVDSPSDLIPRPLKRFKLDSTTTISQPTSADHNLLGLSSLSTSDSLPPSLELVHPSDGQEQESSTRPWKDVYSERMTIERNWRRGRCNVRTFKGHKDGVMCLQFSESLKHPSFPVLITGSYDRTARVWNMQTGQELHCLQGHTRVIRCLQFDEVKLITGSMDHTMKVWDWRRGKCIRTLTGHTEGIVCLHFDSNVLASGSVDSTIKVWNLRTGGAFTLRGHSDWVNSVQLWDSKPGATSTSTSNSSLFDVPGCAAPQIDPGKMLFSASDDGTIKLWDLTLRTCVRQFTGHVGQVQSMKLLLTDDCQEDPRKESSTKESTTFTLSLETSTSIAKRNAPVLISGSLDNTIKIWDIETGAAVQTLFGHIEGVWGVASDKLRLVSASHDRTIKVWSREEGKCTATLVGHRAAVSCIGLGEDKIVSGSDDWDVKVWDFSG